MLKVLIVIQTSGLLLLAACQQPANVTSSSSLSSGSDWQDDLSNTTDRQQQGFNGTESPAPLVSPSEQSSYFYNGGSVGAAGSDQSMSQQDSNDGIAQQEPNQDLNFSLMNAPHERLQAVQHLMDASSSHQSNLMMYHNNQRLSSAASSHHSASDSQTTKAGQQQGLVCSHKGRQYLDGQVVAIEDQPCLNCTCRRAILQCYLRVCPPVVSLEAQRRLQTVSSEIGNGVAQRCRMAKAANQCCPSLRCESETTLLNTTTFTTTKEASILAADQKSRYQMLSSPINNRSMEEVMLASASSQQPQTKLSSQAQDPQPSQDTSHLPKLTVINGASGQRDSILLITSNPHGNHHHHHKTESSKRPEVMEASQALAVPSSTKSDFSTALMEALLETVYAQGAQLSTGLNLEGSCMINGSLYVEGSAVIPEGNALCQYCYCIRQKIMCVRPKCQLIISGCSPRYSNEYACCPTSYTCQSSLSHMDRTPLSQRSGAGLLHNQNPARLADNSSSVQSLSDKLWAAIESIQRVQQQQQTSTSTSPTTTTPAEAISTNANNFTSMPPTSSTSTTTPSTTTTTATTTTMTTTHTMPMTSTEDSSEASSSTTAAPNDANAEVDLQLSPRDASGGSVNENLTTTPSSGDATSPPSTQPTSDFVPTSVSDFLEPMTKLGPLVISPQQPSGCLENGRTYAIGEQIPTLESCKHCYCGLEGLKECKMVECQLKGAHDCRPITPEGHCCPVRYECPPSSPANPGPRYRSELGSDQEQSPFVDVHQCSDAEGLGEGCQRVLKSTSDATTNGVPLVKTTRLVEDLFQTTISDGLPASSSPTVPGELLQTGPAPMNVTTALVLNDEINKFIMQIRQQSLNNSTTNSSILIENSNQQGYSQQQDGPRSQEAMINDQQARMLATPIGQDQDYHSVQPAAVADNHQLPPGLQGIPSIVRADPEPSSNWSTPTTTLAELLHPTTTSPDSLDSGGNNTSGPDYGAVVIGQGHGSTTGGRDSRSAEAKFGVMNELLGLHGPNLSGNNNLELTTARASPAVEGYSGENSSFSGLIRSQQEGNHSAAMVVFDDELGNGPNLTSNRQQPEFFLGPTAEQLQQISNKEPVQTTPSPFGITTGTPLGLDADRSPETRGWLRSLQGFVHSFGRRLTSTNQQADSLNVPAESMDDLHHHHILSEQATARHSTGPNLLHQLLNSLGETASAAADDHVNEKNLVMRPLSEHNSDNKLIMSHLEQPVEIVTAPVALEPEIFQDKDNYKGFAKRSDVAANNDGDTMLGVDSAPQFQVRTGSNRVEKQLAGTSNSNINKINMQRLVVTCYEPATNRTYQPNERIPKQDPCKTCTCVLGEELCQTLVCPERPGDNCSEERRPGECCPNYLCGNNVTQFVAHSNLPQAPNPHVANLLMMRTTPSEANSSPLNSLTQMSSVNMPAEHRMMPTNLGLREGRLPIGQLLRVFPSTSGGSSTPRPPLTHLAPANQQQQQQQRPRQQLPPHPIRTTDLNQLLPAHLRFRPNLQPPSSFASNPHLLTPSTQPASPNNNQILFQPPLGGIAPSWRHQQQDQSRFFGTSNQQQPSALNQFMLNQPQHRLGTVQPPMLMHPPTQQTRQFNPLEGFKNQPFDGGDQAWRASSTSATLGEAAIQQVMAPSSNILLQRINPISLTSVVQSASTTSAPSLSSQSFNSHIINPMDQQTKPVLELASNELTELAKDQRVLFPSSPPQSTETMPIISSSQPQSQRIPQIDLSGAPQAQHPQMDNQGSKLQPDLEAMMPATQLLRASPAPTVQDQKLTDAETSSNSTATPTSIETTSSSTTTTTFGPLTSEASSSSAPETEVSTSSLISSSSSNLPSSSSSTGTTSSSTSLDSYSSSPNSPSEANTAQEPSEEFDPMGAMFRVSECNIYGRIYKVGQPIDELSDACKRCTCTSMGVDCKRNCP